MAAAGRIALVDYGAGNLTSVRKGFAAAGAELFTPATPADLAGAPGIVVPGVGHFGAAGALAGPWRDAIARAVASATPLFGICLGMQWLFEGSDEAPDVPGLGVLAGRCSRLPPIEKVPHVGWNSLDLVRPSELLDGVPSGTHVYFTHAYAAPASAAMVAASVHGSAFAAAVEERCVFGVQFHPEKSADAGLRILRNFVAICSRSA